MKKSPLEIARTYDALGWNVFPVPLGEKSPRVAWKAFQNERTTRYLEGWFSDLEKSNYWVLCGRVSGLVVVDVDSPDAEEWLRGAVGDVLDDCWVVRTAKGAHFYFSYPAGGCRSWSHHDGSIEIDVRSDGGGVVVPPSVHATGKRYKWLRRPGALPALPQALSGPGALRSGQGPPSQTERATGLKKLLQNPPPRGGRNVWLASVAGHFARRYADDRERYEDKVRLAARRKLRPNLPEHEIAKLIESIWGAEQTKRARQAEDPSGLVGEDGRLWLETAEGRAPWANFDMDCIAVSMNPETGRTFYQVVIQRAVTGDSLTETIDGSILGSWQHLKRWLSARRLTVFGSMSAPGPATRLQLYLDSQDPPSKTLLPWLGWFEGLGFVTYEGIIRADGVYEHEGAVPLTQRAAAPFRYGFGSGTEARDVLREVLTFHEPDVCAVFGAWWAACFLKGQIMGEVSLFPFMALEAPSESGKTTGFFALMIELSGNYHGQGEYTIPALRDRLGAHRNGIVWIDDMADPTAALDMIRQATAEGSISKMNRSDAGWEQGSVRLVAPLVLSGEYLVKLHHEKALLDRAVRLKAPSPKHRVSLRDETKSQWDDVIALRRSMGGDLTKVSGTLVRMALRYEQQVGRLRELRVGSGRVADKWAILRFGARVLGAMTEDRSWPKLVDEWVGRQRDLGEESDLTLLVLPEVLAWEGWPDSPISKRHDGPSAVFIDRGIVWYNLRAVSQTWERISRREWDMRMHAYGSLRAQAKMIGPGRGHLWDVGSHHTRARYRRLSQKLSRSVIQRSEAKARQGAE